MIWNPWKRIRELESQLSVAWARLDDAEEARELAEEKAFHRASKYWHFQVEQERTEKMANLAKLNELVSLTPTIFPTGAKFSWMPIFVDTKMGPDEFKIVGKGD